MSLKKWVSLLSPKFAFWSFILFQVFLPSFHYLVRIKTSPLKRDFPFCVNFHPSCFHRRLGRSSSHFFCQGFLPKFVINFSSGQFFPLFLSPIIHLLKIINYIILHSYRASLYYQSFIYSPTDALVICLKTILKFALKFTLKQLRHVSVRLHNHQGTR